MTEASPSRNSRSGRDRVRDWPICGMPRFARAYIILIPVAAAVALGVAAAHTTWHPVQFGIFALLVACGLAMIEATRGVKLPQGTLIRDLQEVWYLSIAVLLPPVFAVLAPIPLMAFRHWRVRRTLRYRRVFTVGANGLSYAAASVAFHTVVGSAGGVGPESRDVARFGAIVAAAVIAMLASECFVVGAVKVTVPDSSVRAMVGNRESAVTDAVTGCLAALVAFALTVSLIGLVVAVPVVLLQKRFLMHAQLTAEARTDAKTDLLNAATWQREAAAELARATTSRPMFTRATRARQPPAVAIIDIDHFKVVNDTHGHLAGDRALRAIADRLKAQLRDGDVIGRFGGEEFAVLLPGTRVEEAHRVAERLRARIADEPVAIGDERGDGALISLTVSVGVAEPDGGCRNVDELLAVADAALYAAKHAGRNRVHVHRWQAIGAGGAGAQRGAAGKLTA